MKEMSTITFPNKSEPYEVVDAAARSDISDLTTNLTNNYETKTDSAAKLEEAKSLINEKADSTHSHSLTDVNIFLCKSTDTVPDVVEGALLVCYDA